MTTAPPPRSWRAESARRWREALGGDGSPGSRIVGIDVARGLAVLGMFGAHVGEVGPFDAGDPASWDGVVDGRSAILFATVAGISIALVAPSRTRLALRGLVLLVLGVALELLATGVAVILPAYGLLFVAATLVLGWSRAALVAAAAIAAVAGPVLVQSVPDTGPDPATPVGALVAALRYFVVGSYPLPVWIVFVVVGMAVGASDLSRIRTAIALAGLGTALAVAGYLGAALLEPVAGDWAALVSTEPHSGTWFEVIAGTGVALAVVGAALVVTRARAARVALFPLASVGALALSAYAAHLVGIRVLFGTAQEAEDDAAWLLFAVVALVACPLWRVAVGRGPLEAAVRRLSSPPRAPSR